MVKNAIAYVTRKKNRSFIVFIILSLVLSCLYSCLTITKSTRSLESSLYKSSNSSISLTKKSANGYFKINDLKNLNNIEEIKEIIPQYEGLAKLTNTKVVESEQKIKRDDLSNEFKNVVSIEGTTNTKRNTLFSSGVFTIKEGKNIEKDDKNKIMVHQEFAKKNNLKLNDKIKLKIFDVNQDVSKSKEYTFEIIGIFSGKKQEKYTGMSSDFSENTMFVDYVSTQDALNKKEEERLANKLTMFTDNPETMDKTLKKIKELNNSSKYNVVQDNNAFKEALESLGGIKHIINIMTYSIMVGGIIVLSLILILWLRERIYEIGILLSIGINKFKIITQFILELLFISLPAVIVSLVFGNLVLNQIIGSFLNTENTGTITNSILNGKNIIENLITFSQSYLILVVIIVVSVVIASTMIIIKKPKEILSKIS
ncbi:MAG: ABC transporter permease [Clostridium sp.]